MAEGEPIYDNKIEKVQKIQWSDISKKDKIKFVEAVETNSLIIENKVYKFFQQKHEELIPVAVKVIALKESLAESDCKKFTKYLNNQISELSQEQQDIHNEWEMVDSILTLIANNEQSQNKTSLKLLLLNIYNYYDIQYAIKKAKTLNSNDTKNEVFSQISKAQKSI